MQNAATRGRLFIQSRQILGSTQYIQQKECRSTVRAAIANATRVPLLLFFRYSPPINARFRGLLDLWQVKSLCNPWRKYCQNHANRACSRQIFRSPFARFGVPKSYSAGDDETYDGHTPGYHRDRERTDQTFSVREKNG